MLQIVSYSHSDSSNNDNKAKYSVKEPALNGMRFPMCNFCSLWLIVYTVSHNIFSETILSTVNKVNIFITIDIPQHLRGQSLTHPPSPQAWYGALSLIPVNVSLSTTVDSDHFPPQPPLHISLYISCVLWVVEIIIKYTVTVVSHICFTWISSTSEIEIIGKQNELLARPNTQWVWN